MKVLSLCPLYAPFSLEFKSVSLEYIASTVLALGKHHWFDEIGVSGTTWLHSWLYCFRVRCSVSGTVECSTTRCCLSKHPILCSIVREIAAIVSPFLVCFSQTDTPKYVPCSVHYRSIRNGKSMWCPGIERVVTFRLFTEFSCTTFATGWDATLSSFFCQLYKSDSLYCFTVNEKQYNPV